MDSYCRSHYGHCKDNPLSYEEEDEEEQEQEVQEEEAGESKHSPGWWDLKDAPKAALHAYIYTWAGYLLTPQDRTYNSYVDPRAHGICLCDGESLPALMTTLL